MIEAFKRIVRRHWPSLGLRTILLLTFVFVAALPGVGALFLRVYENTLVRQTEAELIAQGAALAAAAGLEWSDEKVPSIETDYVPEPPSIDLRMTRILPERPPPRATNTPQNHAILAWSNRLQPVLRLTARTTLASILLLDPRGRVLLGPQPRSTYEGLPEVQSAIAGRPATLLRHNDAYRSQYAFEWLSRASDLRIHHARPVISDGQVVGVLLLSRSPRALFVGIYEDRGKIALGIVLIFATLVILSGLLSRGIVRPIEALSVATRAVAWGGGAVPAPPTTAAVEIQALYRDFGTMAEAIDRRSRYLRDFAHAVSHEFKTPLASISGAVELLQDHPDMAPGDRERFLANMAAGAARLTHLVSRLLDLARADMAEAAEVTATDLQPPLRHVADAYTGSEFAVRLELPQRLSSVLAPPNVIEASVAGLVENCRQAGASTVRLSARAASGFVELMVRDNGPGIPVGDRERIFEPFFTSRRVSGGTGLGLPITRSLLRAYGSTIELDSQSDYPGATFLIRLRVSSVPGAPRDQFRSTASTQH
ncbi:sensor histidine kinase [Sphingomonas xinjiangensis]|uniref:histidine kinase n=1 Tax=Sphingomonas xinjiangensis TaxID=643568 RepID=A0A840YR87_9SPHN|nr:HAMP domain-containing sensor histidine kinase [Sphingomonas xinjiangensis]MBB5712041.1 signal transduction histidine kinase [Sphingomonas xinjiangensis]